MKLSLQQVLGEEKKEKRKEEFTSAVLLFDEAFLFIFFSANAKPSSLNELACEAREELNLTQLLRALHIYRLWRQVMHILLDVPLSTEITNNIILQSYSHMYFLS